MNTPVTQMRREIEEIPNAVDCLLSEGGNAVSRTASEIRNSDIRFLMSVARGSSDHVCTFFKYAAEIMAGLPVASVGPSVASLYKAPLKLSGSICIGVSQSGKSPDIVEMIRSAG
ncbi:MAG: SIS domain-containing protein, partial [Boseongicola sp.]